MDPIYHCITYGPLKAETQRNSVEITNNHSFFFIVVHYLLLPCFTITHKELYLLFHGKTLVHTIFLTLEIKNKKKEREKK